MFACERCFVTPECVDGAAKAAVGVDVASESNSILPSLVTRRLSAALRKSVERGLGLLGSELGACGLRT